MTSIIHHGEEKEYVDIESKLEIICEFEKGNYRTDLAKLYNTPKSTLTGILNKKGVITSEYQTSSSTPKWKRNCSGKYDDADTTLFESFKDARANNVPINEPILKKKAGLLQSSLVGKISGKFQPFAH